MTDKAPKMLMVPHSKPAAPLFPRTKDAAVVDQMSAVNAPISMRSPPRFRDEAIDARDISLAMLDAIGIDRLWGLVGWTLAPPPRHFCSPGLFGGRSRFAVDYTTTEMGASKNVIDFPDRDGQMQGKSGNSCLHSIH